MSKTTPTPKEFQIAGTEDLGCEIVMTRNVPATLSHVTHTVRALSGRDQVSLRDKGYQFSQTLPVASKVYQITSPLGIAVIKADSDAREIIVPCHHGLMTECAACIAETAEVR
jgi:hypothetical protein